LPERGPHRGCWNGFFSKCDRQTYRHSRPQQACCSVPPCSPATSQRAARCGSSPSRSWGRS